MLRRFTLSWLGLSLRYGDKGSSVEFTESPHFQRDTCDHFLTGSYVEAAWKILGSADPLRFPPSESSRLTYLNSASNKLILVRYLINDKEER